MMARFRMLLLFSSATYVSAYHIHTLRPISPKPIFKISSWTVDNDSNRVEEADSSPMNLTMQIANHIRASSSPSTPPQSPLVSQITILLSSEYIIPNSDDSNYLLLLLGTLNRCKIGQISVLLDALSSSEFKRYFRLVEDAVNYHDENTSISGDPWFDGGGGKQSPSDEPRFETWEEVQFKKEFGVGAQGINPPPPGAPKPQLTFYQQLSIEPSSSPEEIKQSFRDLAKIYHPDSGSGGDAELFSKVSERRIAVFLFLRCGNTLIDL